MYITALLMSIGTSSIVAGIVYILLIKRINKERSSSEITKQIRAEIDRMIVDLNQTADRNIGLIEQRLESLGDMVKEADHRISLLQKHSDNVNRSTDTYSRIRPAQVVRQQQGNAGQKPSQPNAQSLQFDQSDRPGEAGVTEHPSRHQDHIKESNGRKSDGKKSSDRQGEDSGVPKRERIISFYRQGFSPDIIASRVDSTVAEVELIISMTEGQG